MSASDDSRGYEQLLSRRTMLALTGTSGLAALAGCSNTGTENQTTTTTTDSEGGDTTSDSSSNSAPVSDATYRNGFGSNPADLNVNTYEPQNYSQLAGRLLHDRYVAYSFATDEFQLVALDDLTFDGTTVRLTLRDDLTWDDGSAVTTRDVQTQLDLLEKTGGELWGYLDDYEVVDETSIELTLKQPTNPRIIKFTLNNMRVDTPHSVFADYLDKPAEEVQTFQWEDGIIASGPWSHVSKDRQAWEFERNSEFYASENITFETFLLDAYGGNSALQQALLSGDTVDGVSSLFVPPKVVEQFPDNVVENRMPSKWGYGIIFNHQDDDFGKRPVRQAIANVLNRAQIVKNGGPRTKFPAPVPCGIAPKNQEQWLGDDMEKYDTYGVDESRTEQAASLLEEAGYSKSGGTWQDSDGNTLGGDYYSPAGWTDWTTMTQTTVSQLNEFGFDFSITTKPTNDWFGQYSNSTFKMGSFYWLPGGARSSFPYFPLRYQLLNSHVGGGHQYDADTEYTIPGLGNSGEMTINPLQEVNSIAQMSTAEEATDVVRRCAWHNNVDLPMLSIVGTNGQQWLTNDEWTLPPEDDPSLKVPRPPMWPIHEGKLTPTQ